jgi:ABC-2 type transport system ATP-binding protein
LGQGTKEVPVMNSVPLCVDGLTKAFGGGRDIRHLVPVLGRRVKVEDRTTVVRGISFEVERGEIYGIIGANGSGKSTLIRMLSTLLLPDSGACEVFGFDVVRDADKVRSLINRVSADPSFFRNMSALENLLFFGRVYGFTSREVRERTPEIAARLGLDWDKVVEPMSNLSRGQQQKVAVARAFLTAPVLMLLDEPTTGLDPRSKRDVQAFIREVQREHDATILLTTHDMDEAEILCNRIAFIAGGRIVAEGTPLQLRRQVANGRPIDSIDMETVFMELTGRSIEEDEDPEEAKRLAGQEVTVGS